MAAVESKRTKSGLVPKRARALDRPVAAELLPFVAALADLLVADLLREPPKTR
jgi:hypothetical protein